MRLPNLIRAALLAAPCLAAHAADIGLMPVTVQLDAQRDRATVQVRNQGSEPVTMQADGLAWIREAGVDRDAPTDELIVNPPLFTVPPGATQVVRLGLRRAAVERARESTYRLVLREVPMQAPDAAGTQVRVLIALRVPVYVAPAQVQRDERWSFERAADGSLLARVGNAGNVHMKIGAMRLLGDGADPAAEPLAEQAASAVLFPGETRSFALRPRSSLPSAPLRIEVQTDRGPQHVPVAFAPR